MARYSSPKHRVSTPAKEVIKKRITHSKIEELRDKYAKKQGYRCPLCQRDLRRLRVTLDHCHKTGYLRGALCNNCNGLEGKLTTALRRMDLSGIGPEQLLRNLAAWMSEDQLKRKYIHPNAETLSEQKARQKKRAQTLRIQKKQLQKKVAK